MRLVAETATVFFNFKILCMMLLSNNIHTAGSTKLTVPRRSHREGCSVNDIISSSYLHIILGLGTPELILSVHSNLSNGRYHNTLSYITMATIF